VTNEVDLVLKIVVAAMVGGVIGLEREVGGHEPGIRTHALVAVGAALFTVAGAYGFGDVRGIASGDPARVAAQVATGVGFIGAGAILRSGGTVRGLTTAATLWVSAAVGVAAGAGIYLPLGAAAALTLAVLVGLRAVTSRLLARWGGVHRRVRIEYERGHGTIGPLMRQLSELRCRVGELHVEDDDDHCVANTGIRRVTIFVQVHDEGQLTAAISALERRVEVHTITLEPLAS
jgi:putative Mg2+ transporter-C (MgtC) family protein